MAKLDTQMAPAAGAGALVKTDTAFEPTYDALVGVPRAQAATMAGAMGVLVGVVGLAVIGLGGWYTDLTAWLVLLGLCGGVYSVTLMVCFQRNKSALMAALL